jgi:hypothetical protein
VQTDPFEARRTGARRLRVLTASLSAAAVVGTGALAWSVAAPSATATTSDESDGSTGTNTGGDDGFVAPSQLPSTTSSGGSHASSGGS